MGCGGSKEVPNSKNNNVTVEVKSTVGDQENAVKKDDANLIESNSIDSPSPLRLTPDINVKNNAVKQQDNGDNNIGQADNARESVIDSAFDGWSDHQPRQSHTFSDNVPAHHNEKLRNIESELDSEYGKDGIDLTSTSFAITNPKQSEVLDHGIQFEVTKRLTKMNSEEPFDPSSLVDIDKFKAVNAPKQAKKIPDKEAVAMDTKQERRQSISNGQVPSPTNYNEYYDEDEKALMESIEQDYVGTVYTTLPGAVM